MNDGKNGFFSALWKRPALALLIFMTAAALAWTLQCSLLQNILGLDILETIAWGAEGTLGHSKHPPLSGWLGWFFSALSGHADWSMYLAAQCCLMFGAWQVFRLAKLFLDEYSAAAAALLLFFLFYYNPSETKFSTYFVEIALAPAAAYYFFSALRDRRTGHWLLFGAICGLGLLNKYTFLLHLAGFLTVFLLRREYRRQFFTKGPWLAAATGFLVFLPHLVWLARNDFVCLLHVEHRVEDESKPFLPLVVLGTALYPFAVQGIALVLSLFPRFRERVRKTINKKLLAMALILTLIPSALFVLIALSGNGVILMWFCTFASWTGIAAVAAFPFVIDRTVFKHLYLLLTLLTLGLFIGTTADLLFSTRIRIHAKPEAIVNPAYEFWKRHSAEPIPVVVGDRWYACVVENYSPARPPMCEANDPFYLKLYQKTIHEKGALLIAHREKLFDNFRKQCRIPLKFQRIKLTFQAPFGKKKTREFLVEYLPPGNFPAE